jgi:hypothetical protein
MPGWLLELCLLVLVGAGCYLLAGVVTTLVLAILLRSELRNASDRPTSRDVAKVVALWPAVVGMGLLFALIMIVNRRDCRR